MAGQRRLALSDSDDDGEQESPQPCIKKLKGAPQEEERSNLGEEKARLVGKVIRLERRGNELRRHYGSFEHEGTVYELGDSVLMSPFEDDKKPHVAIIKDIAEDVHGNVMVIGQWLYRPQEAEKIGGGNWEVQDTRELFYSFHVDEVPAESVMHKCVVHFIPSNKQLPVRSQHPGFIVQKVYDASEKKLWKLNDKDYEDRKQHEIDLLIEKTRERIGELPDIVLEDSSARRNYYLKSKRSIASRIATHPIDLLRVEPTTRFDKLSKAYGSGRSEFSKYHVLLSQFKVLTGTAQRDKWLEKLLHGTQLVCSSKDAVPVDAKHKSSTLRIDGKSRALCTGSYGRDSNAGVKVCWPDTVIPIITVLERVTYEALDFQKYNQKMRQLEFNIKNSPSLARRLLNKELEPISLLTMTPDELKDGLTADERIVREPEQTDQIQMTDARCSRCMEKKVHVCDVICAGGERDRYQLECNACGNTWFATRDDFTSLTTDAPNVVGNVGTAP